MDQLLQLHDLERISNGEQARSPVSISSLDSSSPIPMTTASCELAEIFECNVCFEVILPPIMQCHFGHLVCSKCRPRLSICPTCRGPLGNIRNLAMEKVANKVKFPCRYKHTGCRVSLGWKKKEHHEEMCEYRPYTCPSLETTCHWQGELEDVVRHLKNSHKDVLTLNGEETVFSATAIYSPKVSDWIVMQICFRHCFIIVLQRQETSDGHIQFCSLVQLVGSKKQARRFTYKLQLNGHGRRLTWEAGTRSIHKDVANAVLESDCLIFDTSVAQSFIDDNGNLDISITISRDE